MSAYRCLSADSHVVEPAHAWVANIDPQFRDRAPHIEIEDGFEVMRVEEVAIHGLSQISSAGKPKSAVKPNGTYKDDVYPGGYDPNARLKEQDQDGVQGEVMYPSLGMRLYGLSDSAFRAACFRAYNSWMAEYCAPHPNRIKGLALISLDDVESATAEVKRAQENGLAGLVVGLFPDESDTQYDNPTLEPFWRIAQDLEMPVSLHILTNKGTLRARTPGARSTEGVWAQQTIATLIFGGVFQKFPGLRVISAENDGGWAPYLMERMNYVFDCRKSDNDYPIGTGHMRPSDYFKQNVYCTFMRDHTAVLLREQIGIDHLMWSSDFPHFDSTWPHSQNMIESLFDGVPREHQQRIVADNCAELYKFS